MSIEPIPAVSVVMAVCDGGTHLARAVDSIRAQTVGDWELIIVDDGSQDATPQLLSRLVAADVRIRVLRQENTGLTRALIRGCEAARAPIIARHDADDVSHPERLEQQLDLLRRNANVGFVSCWTQYVGPDEEPLEIMERPVDPDTATRRLLENRQGPPAHGSVMFRSAQYRAAGGYRPEFYFAQDSDLWLRLAERSLLAYVPRVLYQWRRDLHGISGRYRDLQWSLGELAHACRRARLAGLPEAPHLAAANALSASARDAARYAKRSAGNTEAAYIIGSFLARQGHPRAVKYLTSVLRSNPWHWRACVRLTQCYLVRAGLFEVGRRA